MHLGLGLGLHDPGFYQPRYPSMERFPSFLEIASRIRLVRSMTSAYVHSTLCVTLSKYPTMLTAWSLAGLLQILMSLSETKNLALG